MITMIVEDVAVATVIAVFLWLVPMRRHGIPGLRGRGRAPVSPMAAGAAPEPRPVPVTEHLGAVSHGGHPAGRHDRMAAQLSQFRGTSYAGPGPAQERGHKSSA
jgi:hypothetical protein